MINHRFITKTDGNLIAYTFRVHSTYFEILKANTIIVKQSKPDTICKGYGCTSNRGKPFSFTFGYRKHIDTIFCTDCSNDFIKENTN